MKQRHSSRRCGAKRMRVGARERGAETEIERFGLVAIIIRE